jgi:hypothetical protein
MAVPLAGEKAEQSSETLPTQASVALSVPMNWPYDAACPRAVSRSRPKNIRPPTEVSTMSDQAADMRLCEQWWSGTGEPCGAARGKRTS